MLDKSVPYIDVIMHRPPFQDIPESPLPAGHRFVLYKPGDEKYWAETEASVLEFPSAVDALLYFQKTFLPFGSELERRCLFIENEKGEKVATAIAWWAYSGIRRDPWLDWISVRPDCQGQGMGKAIVGRVVQLSIDIEGDRDLYLHTQTWSYRAIGIYKKFGFHVTDVKGLRGYPNTRYAEAVAMLDELSKKRQSPPPA